MAAIDLEIWEPNPDDPRYLRYVGQPRAEDVFAQLEQRLTEQGWLPDEYFQMDREWEHGREIPKGADIFCITDWGGSEGVYVDVYLKWYEDGKPITRTFLNAIKGFMAVNLFTIVPVRLYELAISLQGELTRGLTGYGQPIGDVANEILEHFSSVETVAEHVDTGYPGFGMISSAFMVIFCIILMAYEHRPRMAQASCGARESPRPVRSRQALSAG